MESKTGQELKKEIVDLSKTKKRKEFEHDNKIQQKFTTFVAYSQVSEHQTKQARKVGKKIIGEIEAQIAELLQLRETLHNVTKEKEQWVLEQQPSSFLVDKSSVPQFATALNPTVSASADDKDIN